jgi:uncharacterized membrane protein YozB (DUF420 family)
MATDAALEPVRQTPSAKEIMLQRASTPWRIMQALACLLVGKTIVAVVLTYPSYFPPNFRSDFLLGRSAYFFGPYQWAFYTHIISGPLTLLVGLVLLSNSVRRKTPQWHRRLGRIQVACVLLLLTPSGLWMAWYSATGVMAATGFATLALMTAFCVANGWRSAMRKRFDQHRLWMLRGFALLCSAVVLRILGGISDVLGAEWTYPFAAWLSWLLPLLLLEILRTRNPAAFPLQR